MKKEMKKERKKEMVKTYRYLSLQILTFPLAWWVMYEITGKQFSMKLGAFVIMAYLVFQLKRTKRQYISYVNITNEERNRLTRIYLTGFLTYALLFTYTQIMLYKQETWTNQPVLASVIVLLQVVQTIFLILQMKAFFSSKNKNTEKKKEKV